MKPFFPMHTSQVRVTIVRTPKIPTTRGFRAFESPGIHMLGVNVSLQCPLGGEGASIFTAPVWASKIALDVTNADGIIRRAIHLIGDRNG